MSLNQPNITNNAFTAASNSLNNVQQNAEQKLNNAKDKVNELAQEQKAKLDKAKKALEDKQQFVQDQANIDPSAAKNAIIGLVLPLLTKFINTEKTANAIINKLIKTTKKRLKDKGRVEIRGTEIVFYPRNPGDYSRFKRDFDRKVESLKKIVKTLKTIIDSLVVVLKIIKTTLIALRIQLQVKKKKLLAIAAASSPDLSSPSPAKPIAAQYPIDKEINDQVSILQIFQRMINNLKAKLELLSFNINQNSVTKSNISLDIDEIDNAGTTTEYNDGNRNYTIEVITTPSGALQAVAYDAFSRLKITQTAPSKTRKAEELINEIKLILG